MPCNTTEFDSRLFTQTDGATIGSPDSGSVTDIFGAIHINKVIQEHCPIPLEDYCRYRDDMLDICTQSSIEEQKQATAWTNNNIYKNKIKFTADYDDKKIDFLDTRIKVEEVEIGNTSGLFLVSQMYSKSTDTHQFLHPSSFHASHVVNNLPTSVIIRIRRNCSDRVENDGIFKDTVVEYKRYLLKSGYSEELIDENLLILQLK